MKKPVLAAVVVVVALIVLTPGASAAPAAAEDFATGVGSSRDFTFDFTARSDPSGENPIGTFSAEYLGFHFEGPVICLKVEGNVATLVFVHDTPMAGPWALVTVVDKGPLTPDTIAAGTYSIPKDCSARETTLEQPLIDGDIVVHDAQPFPTSKQQCKNGGWRNFPGFRNQGQCIVFVIKTRVCKFLERFGHTPKFCPARPPGH